MKFLLALMSLSIAGLVNAQPPRVDQPPPPIQFENWKEVPSDVDTAEFEEVFPSAYTSPYPQNDIVPLRIFFPAQHDHPLPAVIILHYWGATNLKLEEEFARQLNERDVAAVIMTLPYHLSRTPPGYHSGQLAVVPDPSRLVETMTQAVLDVRRTADFMQSRPEFLHDHMGISGTSLGSLVATLAFGIDRRFTDASFVLGGLDLADIIWHSSRVVQVRDAMRRRGYTEEKLRALLAPIEPGRYLAGQTGDHVLIIGGKYDTVIPAVDTQKLIRALPGAKVVWLDTGHYGGFLAQERIVRTVADFYQAQNGGKSFAAPSHLYAPTLRIGALLNTDSGLQVGAGIDLFHIGDRGQVMSTLIATPRGLNLFAGFNLSHGLAIGGFATKNKASVGLWWSTVL